MKPQVFVLFIRDNWNRKHGVYNFVIVEQKGEERICFVKLHSSSEVGTSGMLICTNLTA